MLRLTKQGFTLIELMVVIVIIGVLASLAIPRFTDASIKAKVAEAPRIIASFESAYLAGVAEGNVASDNLVFSITGVNDDSKWFTYTYIGDLLTGGSVATNGDGVQATASGALGKLAGQTLEASYETTSDIFTHSYSASISKYVPNFKK
jgi:prepilin-type N-terminal cleavage/methylation domain-containing protein